MKGVPEREGLCMRVCVGESGSGDEGYPRRQEISEGKNGAFQKVRVVEGLFQKAGSW